MVEKKLAATDVLAFRPGHLCDPPPWFIRELDFRTLKDLAINEVKMHQAILEAQIKASERTLDILESLKG